MGSSVACFPSYWFWSLAMALITNQLCTNCRFYHLIFYNQFLKVCELKTGSNTHWYIIITPVTFERKCKCSGEYIFQSRLSNWILKNRATDKGAAICLCAHENMSWNYSACYKSWNVINTSDVQRISWNILSPLLFCVKSTSQYFNCTQQQQTGERAKSWTSPQRNLFSFLQTCQMMPGFKSTISPSLLSAASQPPLSGLKGALSLEQFQHVENWHMGKRYRSRVEEGNRSQGKWKVLVKEGLFEPQEANQKERRA